MDAELVRFQVDAELLQRAERVCGELGVDLTTVLRIVITQIARDGALPFALGARMPAASAAGPSHTFDNALWSALKPQVDAELAIALLVGVIADRSADLDDAREAAQVDADLVARLTRERAEAIALRDRLDVADPAAVAQVLTRFSALRGKE